MDVTLQELIQITMNNGLQIVIIWMLLIGIWKGIPSLISYGKDKVEEFLDNNREKDKAIIASVQEIQANNTTLAKAIENIEARVTKTEETVEQILEIVTK